MVFLADLASARLDYATVSISKKDFEQLDGRVAQLGYSIKEVRTAVQDVRNETFLSQFKQHWWQAVVVVVGFVATTAGALWTVTSHFKTDIDGDVGKLDRRVTDLQGDVGVVKGSLDELKPLIHDLLADRLARNASLSKAEFEKQIPELNKLLSIAVNGRIPVDDAVLRSASHKLLEIGPKAPETWSAAAQLVSLRSIQNIDLADAKLKICTDGEPTPMTVESVQLPHTVNFRNGSYENCIFELDSAEQNKTLNEILSKRVPYITFHRCLVVYRGGPVHLIVSWNNRPSKIVDMNGKVKDEVSLSGEAIHFDQCLFQLRLANSPPLEGQKFTEALLAMNGNSVSFAVAPESHAVPN